MAEKKYNASCPVCGKGFKVCRTCKDNNLASWKMVADTEDCFKVFVILHGVYVTETITKEEAKKKLINYKFEELVTYPEYVQKQIKEILEVKPSNVVKSNIK